MNYQSTFRSFSSLFLLPQSIKWPSRTSNDLSRAENHESFSQKICNRLDNRLVVSAVLWLQLLRCDSLLLFFVSWKSEYLWLFSKATFPSKKIIPRWISNENNQLKAYIFFLEVQIEALRSEMVFGSVGFLTRAFLLRFHVTFFFFFFLNIHFSGGGLFTPQRCQQKNAPAYGGEVDVYFMYQLLNRESEFALQNSDKFIC